MCIRKSEAGASGVILVAANSNAFWDLKGCPQYSGTWKQSPGGLGPHRHPQGEPSKHNPVVNCPLEKDLWGPGTIA